jgi:hypothetical protein
MPMARGLDQYLANRISSQGVFRVVTDPKLADAVITDLIGEVFQTQLENISPTPKPVEPQPAATPETKTPAPAAADAAAKPADAAAKPADPAAKPAPPLVVKADGAGSIDKPVKRARSRIDENGSVVSMFADTENKVAPPVSTFGRGKGTIFLVDSKSRQVVWSTFDPSKGNRNLDLDRTASDIVSRLKKDLKPKKP